MAKHSNMSGDFCMKMITMPIRVIHINIHICCQVSRVLQAAAGCYRTSIPSHTLSPTSKRPKFVKIYIYVYIYQRITHTAKSLNLK